MLCSLTLKQNKTKTKLILSSNLFSLKIFEEKTVFSFTTIIYFEGQESVSTFLTCETLLTIQKFLQTLLTPKKFLKHC
jgi:hypothetical protein